METLQVLKSRDDVFSRLLERESFDGMRGLVNSKEETDKTSWERSETADHSMRLLTLGFLKHLHGLLGKNTLYALENGKLFEWSAAQELCFSAQRLPRMLATFGVISAHPL